MSPNRMPEDIEKAEESVASPTSSDGGAFVKSSFRGNPISLALDKIRITLEMIKFEHSIFALPYALTGALLAAEGWPTAGQVFWIVVACVFARSAAMAWNRLLDAQFDRQNPRTHDWALPSGLLSRGFVWIFVIVCVAGFVFSAKMLNDLAVMLSPLALAILLGYSLTKRFTSYTHLFLGLALGIAPVGAWVAVRGELGWPPIVLGLGVMFWTAGFDMIYSLQDVDIDKRLGLNSLPVKFGNRRALGLSALSHAISVAAFAALVPLTALGPAYLLALSLCAWLLVYEQRLVSPTDISRLPVAFFTLNGWISVLMFCGATIDLAPGIGSSVFATLVILLALVVNLDLLRQILSPILGPPLSDA